MEHLCGLLKGIYILSEPMVHRLEQEHLLELYAKIELPLSELLATMEYEGVRIDTAYLQQLGAELRVRIDQLAEKLYETAGERFILNSSSSWV